MLKTQGPSYRPDNVWAVVFSNYYPEEVDSLWWEENDADKRAKELNANGSMWSVRSMAVQHG